MILNRRFLCLLLAVFSPVLTAHAQFYQSGSDPFGRWNEQVTGHLRVVYPRGLDSLAHSYAVSLEQWRPAVGQSAGMAPGAFQFGKTPVVLHPFYPYSNGSVAWAPKRMDLYTHPEPYGSLPQSWLTQLSVHESRHLAQMQLAYRKPFRWVNYLVGEMWPGAVTALFLPEALLEGDAVVAETALTASGRGRNADFLNYFHVAYDNGDWRDWYQWVHGSFKRAAPDHYATGYMTVAGMRYFFDQPLFTAEYMDHVRRHPLPVASFQRFIARTGGKSFRETYRSIQEGFHALWAEEAEARGPFMDMEQVSRKPSFATDYTCGAWIDGKYYVLKEGKTVAMRLVRLFPDGREQDLGAFSGHASSFYPGEERIYWTETLPGTRWTLDGKSIIRYLDAKGRPHDLTRSGRLYNPQPGPDGLATVEYPVEGGCNLLIISEDDGSILHRTPAPEGVQLTESAWLGEDLYCLGVDDRGFGIWRLRSGSWTCVLEPSVQAMENLDGGDDALEVVSDRNGVKELYRFDPATGRAWQLSNSRYGGTDYSRQGDTLWFCSQTPEGMAIFKAKAPEPVEVDLRTVHRYRVAEKLSEQEQALAAEPADTAAEEPRPYRKAAHLMKIHSWAPLWFSYDAVSSMSMDLSYDTASPGLTGFFQNDLGTFYGTLGYATHPDPEFTGEWRHSVHAQFTYEGLFPVLEGSFDLYDKGVGQFTFQRRNREDGGTSFATVRSDRSGPSWAGSLRAYIPFRYNKGGVLRGWIPQVSWTLSNSLFDNGTVDLLQGSSLVGQRNHLSLMDIDPGQNRPMQTVRGSVRGYWMLPTADSQVYPRMGIGAETGFSFRPRLTHLYTPVWYGYLYGYLPGFSRTQGLRLTVSAQQQAATGAPFGENSVNVWPRGFTSVDGLAVARASTRQAKVTADYALPVYVGDISLFSPVAYIRNFLIIPHFDWTTFGGRRIVEGLAGKETASSLVSAGVDLTVEMAHFLWAPFPCSLGVSASWLGGPYFSTLNADGSRKPWSVELIFSLDI